MAEEPPFGRAVIRVKREIMGRKPLAQAQQTTAGIGASLSQALGLGEDLDMTLGISPF